MEISVVRVAKRLHVTICLVFNQEGSLASLSAQQDIEPDHTHSPRGKWLFSVLSGERMGYN